MNDKLVVRVFNVAVGDCIYVGVPDGADTFHILIDCGTRGSLDCLTRAIDQIKGWLSPASNHRTDCSPGDKWLDLLVVTHPDNDHLNGFDMQRFKGMRVGQIWLNPLMNSKHPQAGQSLALMELASLAAQALLDKHEQGFLSLDEQTVERLQVKAEGKEHCLSTLLKDLDPLACPRWFMCRDRADPGQVSQTKGSGAPFKFEKSVTCFDGFKDPDTRIRILAPEWDIDGTYLGHGHTDYRGLLEGAVAPAAVPTNSKQKDDLTPTNISVADFWQLRNGMQYSAMSFLGTEENLTNNTSLVLLIEWKGHRLLFPGDAECEGKQSSWKIMLERAKLHLKEPLDFLKVGHHGSVNATPLTEITKGGLVNLLSKTQSQIVVSTKAGTYPGMPARSVMEELGKRASNAKNYDDDWGKQPERTDKANQPYVEVFIPPSN